MEQHGPVLDSEGCQVSLEAASIDVQQQSAQSKHDWLHIDMQSFQPMQSHVALQNLTIILYFD